MRTPTNPQQPPLSNIAALIELVPFPPERMPLLFLNDTFASTYPVKVYELVSVQAEIGVSETHTQLRRA
jgi:hypothetical protein